LASEYGWGKKDIINDIFPDELFYLMEQIKNRKLGQYRMLLAIVQNPHSKNPNILVKQLQPEEIRNRQEEIDRNSLENLKRNLDKRSGIKLK